MATTKEHIKKPCQFFLMYDLSDKDQVTKLKNHLFLLQRTKQLDFFDMHEFHGGNIDEMRENALKKTQYVLACITSSFLFSNYDLAEKAQKSGIPIIAIKINHTILEDSFLDNLFYLPSNGKTIAEWPNEDAAYLDIVKVLKEIAKQHAL